MLSESMPVDLTANPQRYKCWVHIIFVRFEVVMFEDELFDMDENATDRDGHQQTAIKIDPHFEPQMRGRSNTWPLPQPDNYVDPNVDASQVGLKPDDKGGVFGPKKNSSRRNAWGNTSYAELISMAIDNSPEKRLTLSQIYDWMVENVPYFKDKGDSNSSAGWKVSSYFDYIPLGLFTPYVWS